MASSEDTLMQGPSGEIVPLASICHHCRREMSCLEPNTPHRLEFWDSLVQLCTLQSETLSMGNRKFHVPSNQLWDFDLFSFVSAGQQSSLRIYTTAKGSERSNLLREFIDSKFIESSLLDDDETNVSVSWCLLIVMGYYIRHRKPVHPVLKEKNIIARIVQCMRNSHSDLAKSVLIAELFTTLLMGASSSERWLRQVFESLFCDSTLKPTPWEWIPAGLRLSSTFRSELHIVLLKRIARFLVELSASGESLFRQLSTSQIYVELVEATLYLENSLLASGNLSISEGKTFEVLVGKKMQSLQKVPSTDVFQAWHITQALPTMEYMESLVSGAYYLPFNHISYSSFEDYLTRCFSLLKASVCLQIWNRLRTAPETSFSTASSGFFCFDPVGDDLEASDRVALMLVFEDTPTCRIVRHLQSVTIPKNTRELVQNVPGSVLFLLSPMECVFMSVLASVVSLNASMNPAWTSVLLGTYQTGVTFTRIAQSSILSDFSNVIGLPDELFPDCQAVVSHFQESGASFQLILTEKWRSSIEFAVPPFRVERTPRHASSLLVNRLYKEQQDAAVSCLFSPLTIVVGPPGTGKTHTSVSAVSLLIQNCSRTQNEKILVVAHSNSAVDQLLERLAVLGAKCHRMGGQSKSSISQEHTTGGKYARVFRDLQVLVKALFADLPVALHKTSAVCLLFQDVDPVVEKLIADGPSASPFKYRDSLKSLTSWILSVVRAGTDPAAVISSTDDVLGQYMSRNSVVWMKFRSIVEYCIAYQHVICANSKRILDQYFVRESDVICLTLSGVSILVPWFLELGISPFAILLEEAAKILEVECLPLFQLAPRRLILIGDDLQLAPLVEDDRLRYECHFSRSLFERLRHLQTRVHVLNRQARAHTTLCNLYRWRYEEEFAERQLEFRDLVVHPQQATLKNDVPCLVYRSQFVHVFRAMAVVGEGESAEENDVEADFIERFVQFLTKRGVQSTTISILTPYRRQKARLSRQIPSVDCYTVDEFQGRENDIIIGSLVSNAVVPSEFLCSPTRINVFSSRARKAFYLFGNRSTFLKSEEWARTLHHMDGFPFSELTVLDDFGNKIPCSSADALRMVCR
eukprot:ANDGO_06732.mRNA.1 Regulator of nonsense transcripts 1 homolog